MRSATRGAIWRAVATVLGALPIAQSAFAADSTLAPKTDPPTADCQFASTGIPSPSIATSLQPGLADPGGVRAALGAHGIQMGLNYINDVMANTTGGLKRGAIYQGRLEYTFDACLGKLIGWPDANFHVNFYQTHGTGLSRYYVGNVLTTSLIEALPATRLFEIFIQQKLFDGKLDIRFGQLAADSEFVASSYVNVLMNASFGWPAILAANLPSGGPAFPLATPGVRVKYQLAAPLLLMAGLYNGDPAGPGLDDPQRRDNHGLNFRVRDKPFLIGEAAYQYSLADALPGTVKIGAWRHFGSFSDQRFGTDGFSLADPASNATPRRHRGNYGYYAVLDQLLWQKPAADAGNGIGAFARVFGNPADRNQIGFYADGGLNFKGLMAARPNDAFGIGASFARVSSRLKGLDHDALAFGGTAPVRNYEAGLEAGYTFAIVDGWTIQPDIQYIFHPGLHVANFRDPTGRAIKDALVFGLHSTVNY